MVTNFKFNSYFSLLSDDCSYANDEIVLGDLTKYGWVVVRSRHINAGVETDIRNICGRGSWYTIEKHRLMKYQTSTPRSSKWTEGKIEKHLNLFQPIF